MYLWALEGYFDIEFPKKNVLCLILISKINFARYEFPLGGVVSKFLKENFQISNVVSYASIARWVQY